MTKTVFGKTDGHFLKIVHHGNKQELTINSATGTITEAPLTARPSALRKIGFSRPPASNFSRSIALTVLRQFDLECMGLPTNFLCINHRSHGRTFQVINEGL